MEVKGELERAKKITERTSTRNNRVPSNLSPFKVGIVNPNTYI
jgi:hypothetical protein